MSFPIQNSKPSFATIFETVDRYRSENHIFQTSVDNKSDDNQFRFYDGPPFVTGLPHYGHLASSVAKDVIPRYQTMLGKKVDRVRGRDCHGIPIEQKVQAKLGLESNLDIEKVGIEAFIQGCYDYTRSTSSEWKRYIDQFARWVDFDNSYKTMDNDYMESVRRVFKTLRDKGLIYKGKRVSLYSTKLETPISNFEVAMDDTYEEVNDPAITVIFELEDGKKVLAWTTTPWTIPLNIALAVNKDVMYAIVECGDEDYIVAANRVEAIFLGKDYAVMSEIPGSALIGVSYKPPYDYLYGNTGNDYDHKIYHADFVTDTDGTGIAHEAPEFGEADFQLAKQVGLTITEGMDSSGHYTSLLAEKAGLFYREANPLVIQELHEMKKLFNKASITHRVAFCPRSGTPLVYKAQDSWFIDINGPKEMFGGKSLKQKCIEANEDINRYPEHNKHGRFLKSLESAPDRCISRTRYRGTPMPIYKSSNSNDIVVIGSREELFELSKTGSKNLTKLVLVRHGRTNANDEKFLDGKDIAQLTELGKQQAQHLTEKLKDIAPDVIYSSPFTRCIDTVTPFAQSKNKEIIQDTRLREIDFGKFDGPQGEGSEYSYANRVNEKRNYYLTHRDVKFGDTGQESYAEFEKRIEDFIQEILEKHPGQTVVISSHSDPLFKISTFLHGIEHDRKHKDKYVIKNNKEDNNFKVEYVNITRNNILDLHRPYIDDIWFEKDGIRYERISEVLDCRVESASMPYAQVHYPFENKEKFERSFPADYIVEYTGQIRAWFYVMHVLGVALFDKPAFKNVICHGVIAGNDGRKMSKSLGNFPDPKPTFEQYGGDAVRMSILTTSLFNGGDMSFSEDLIRDALKQNILPLWNAFYFFTTYANIDGRSHTVIPAQAGISNDMLDSGSSSEGQKESVKGQTGSENLLDQWILAELQSFITIVQSSLNTYDLTNSSRQIAVFLDNLTNRYIRRSRRRFRKSENDGDKNHAYQTLYTVLVEFCKTAAPFMPIVTEYIYRALTEHTSSVHLQSFPSTLPVVQDESGKLSTLFSQAQTIVRAGLAARSKRSIRVRQPLASLKMGREIDTYFSELIADELNIKHVSFDPTLNERVTKICKPDGKAIGAKFGGNTKQIFELAKSGQFTELDNGNVRVGERELDAGSFEITYIKKDESDTVEVEEGIAMEIDRNLTDDLMLEGYARDLVRSIQDARKDADYDIADRIMIQMSGGKLAEDLINHHGAYIQEETLSTISYTLSDVDITKSLELAGQSLILSIKRNS